jgi:bifunctional DNase/RNase
VFEDLIKLRVADVKVAVPAGNGVEAGLVVLEEEDYPYRTLRMFIGQPEARAIHGPWSNVVPPRPSTWDLFVSTVSLLDGRIERVVITDVEELRHYFAQLVLIYQGHDDVPLLVTARPSDALALALRAYGAGIYAEPHVLDTAGLLSDGTTWVRPESSADEEAEAVADDPGEDEPVDDQPVDNEPVHESEDGSVHESEDGSVHESEDGSGEAEPDADGAESEPTEPDADDDVDHAAVARAALASEWGAEALSATAMAPDSEPAVVVPDVAESEPVVNGKKAKKKKTTKDKAGKKKGDKKADKGSKAGG